MPQTKRAWKLQEFVAHGANVNCLAMGHKTGRVMVTGGEDRKVNLWTAGKPNCIMSLVGHTTPIESVRFGHNEEMVVAGSMSGALKIWNLEEAKIMRTLTGHKSSIRSLDFHPYGDYAASGSLDCNIKLWDIRRKGCIYTYKGHTNCVNCLRFSPDGRWIASAGEDGLIKLWDLTAGKMLTDLRLHTAGVNVVEFHPNELLLSSGSSDRTVKFWDLENFQLVSSTDQDASPVRCVYFDPDGSCMYSGVKDFLKVYGWEPAQCFDSVPITWGEVMDMSTTAQNQLIGASFSKTNVSTFVVDLKLLQPHGGVPHQEGGNTSLSSSRKNYLTERPPTQSSRQSSIPKEDVEEPHSTSPDNDNESAADIKNPEDYREIFQAKPRLARDDDNRSPVRKAEPFQPPDDDDANMPEPETEPVKQPAPTKKTQPPSKQNIPKTAAKVTPRMKPPEATPTDLPPVEQPRTPPPGQARPAPSRIHEQPKVPPPQRSQPRVQESQPPTVNPADFLPASAKAGGEPSSQTEESSLDVMCKGHSTMTQVLAVRSKNLQTVRVMWTSGNTKFLSLATQACTCMAMETEYILPCFQDLRVPITVIFNTAIDSAISMNDQAVIVDVLNILNAKSGLWNLDICSCLLPHLRELLASKYEAYVMIACDSLKIVLKNFGPVIKANLTAPPGMGVDISREERSRKCNVCYKVLMDIRSVIDKKTSLAGKVGDTFRQLQILLGTLD